MGIVSYKDLSIRSVLQVKKIRGYIAQHPMRERAPVPGLGLALGVLEWVVNQGPPGKR